MDGDQAMTKMQEMLDWAWEKHREKIFGVHGEYPIDAYVHFAAGYEAAGEPQSSKQRSWDLTKLAAECHRAKWQFDFSDENRLPVSQARDMVKRSFGELHRIGDMALKLRDELDTRPDRKCK
jgi:hypothetical protein